MEKRPQKIEENSIQLLNTIIKNVVKINENTVGIELDKNIVIFNHENILSISKKNNIVIGNTIHLNPNINLNDFYENPENLSKMLEESIEKQKKENLFTKCSNYIKNKLYSLTN